MVYISSPLIATASRHSVMQAQSDLATVQQELSSGTLADAGVTLGARSGRLVSLQDQQSNLQSITDSNALATTRLSATTSALDTIRTAATSFLAALTTANSAGGATSATTTTAAGDLSALTAALNTSVSGRYIFAGINSAQQPLTTYTQSPPSSTKQAVDTAFSAAFGTSQTATGAGAIDGTAMQSFLDTGFASLFSSASFKGSWSSASDQVIQSQISSTQTVNSSVSANDPAFRQLSQAYAMVSEFTGATMSSTAKQAVLTSATALVTSALKSLTDTEASVGAAQTAVSTANDSMAAQITLLKTESGNLDGVDSYALTTKVSALQTQIQASYELTAKLQQMSLVNYL